MAILQQHPAAEVEAGGAARERGPLLPGLVGLSKTSPTRSVTVGRQWARLSRCGRSVKHFADLAEDQAAGGQIRRLLITLTYRPGAEWAARHCSAFIEAARAWMTRRGHSLVYVEVAELQQRGAVHFHIVLWLPARLRFPHPDRRGWWPHGMSNVKPCRRPVAYLAKYASKLTTKTESFPRGLRLHASGGLCARRRRWRSWLMLPRYIREATNPADNVQRVSGGGFLARETGEFFRARWRLDSHAPDWGWVRFVELEATP